MGVYTVLAWSCIYPRAFYLCAFFIYVRTCVGAVRARWPPLPLQQDPKAKLGQAAAVSPLMSLPWDLGDSSQAATTPAARRASLSCTGDFQPFWGFPYGITPKHEERRHPAGASTQREGGSASGTEVALTPPGGWERWQKIHLWEHEVNVKPFPCGVWLCQTSPCPWSARVLDTCRAQRGKYSQIQRLWDGTAPAQWKKAPTG